MNRLSQGRWNLAAGLLGLAFFMVYGFALIYLRDFAPGHEEWAANYATGTHFESRLAHVHGALFSVLNVVLGLVVGRLAISNRSRGWIAGLGLAGLLMPLGIVAEFTLGVSPIFVLIGAASILVSFSWAGVAALKPLEAAEVQR